MKKKIIIFLLIVIPLVAIEVGLRYFHVVGNHIHPGVNKYDEALGYKFDPDGSFTLCNKTVQFNKYGYVGNDWTPNKNPGQYRVALAGTCILTGTFHLKNNCPVNFIEGAAEELASENYNVELLNFGMPGENRSYFIFKSIEEDVLEFNPDVVILEWQLPFSAEYYVRDHYQGYEIEYLKEFPKTREEAHAWINTLNSYNGLNAIYENSYALQSLGRYYVNRFDNDFATYLRFLNEKQVSIRDESVVNYYTMERSLELCKELKARLEKQNIKFYLMDYKKSATIAKLCQDNDLPLLQLGCTFEAGMIVPNDDHLNEAGQQHVKANFIKELEVMIPEQFKNNPTLASK